MVGMVQRKQLMGGRIAESCFRPRSPRSSCKSRQGIAGMKHHGILRDTVTCEVKTRGDTWSTPGIFIVNTVVKNLPERILQTS